MLKMINNSVKICLLSCLFFFLQPFSGSVAQAQSFEGSITFQKVTMADTSYNVYHVKDNMVRIDELNNHKKLVSYHLVDLEAKSIVLVDPSKSSFANIPVHFAEKTKDPNIKVSKTENQKSLLGINCVQWIAKNEKEKTQIIYWVAGSEFSFFDQLLRIQNKTEKKNLYYLQIDNSRGYLPLESTERTMTWQVKMAICATNIKKAKLSNNLFKVPNGYKDINKY